MTEEDARAFGTEWIAAWNSHDLERILSHYHDDVVVTSAFVGEFVDGNDASLKGKPAVRAYWRHAFDAFPTLEFELFKALPGPNSVVLYYKSVRNLLAAEFMRLDANRLVTEVVAHYLPPTTD